MTAPDDSLCETSPLWIDKGGDAEYGATPSEEDGNHNNKLSSINPDLIPSIHSRHKIGAWASLAIMVNSLTGPAMLDLPATFQMAGFVPTTLVVLFVCGLSSLCSLHLANTISKVPNNATFRHEVEFAEAFLILKGKTWFWITQGLFFGCVSILNISSLVDTAQVVDTIVGHVMGSAGLLFSSTTGIQVVRWNPQTCTDAARVAGDCLPFANLEGDGPLLTVGYVLVVIMFFPLACMDLKENAAYQVLGLVVLLVTSLQFAFEFCSAGVNVHNLSLWGDDWSDLFGVVLFNFCLVIAIPAWLYEKESSVDVPTVVHRSTGVSALLYIVVGSLGALAIPDVSNNMLESMMSGAFGTSMQLGASVFAFFIVGLGIPLFSVLIRMSLEGSGLCSHAVANIFAVYLPFSISWLLYQGQAVVTLLAWGGVIFTSAVAFLLPLLLALHTTEEFDREGSIPVYGKWFKTKRAQVLALKCLLSLAVVSVGFAILGTFVFTGP